MKYLCFALWGLIIFAGMSCKGGGIPSDPCKRLEFCKIDSFCGENVYGGHDGSYKTCGDEPDCKAVGDCVSMRMADKLRSAADKDIQAASKALGWCGTVSGQTVGFSDSPHWRKACEQLFDKVASQVRSENDLHACLGLYQARSLGPDFAARHQKLCKR